jgi:hypothetical protein
VRGFEEWSGRRNHADKIPIAEDSLHPHATVQTTPVAEFQSNVVAQ